MQASSSPIFDKKRKDLIMKRVIAAMAACASAVVLAFALCACGSQTSSMKDDSAATYSSGSIVKCDDMLYYAGFSYIPSTKAEIEGATKIPVETSNFLVYDNKAYYSTSPNGTSGDSPVEIHVCALDGSDDKTLVSDATPDETMYVVDGYLVYQHLTALDENGSANGEDIGWTNDSCYWAKLDLGKDGAEPAPLNDEKNIQVVAASADAIFYAKTDYGEATTKNLYKAGIDLSNETTVHEGSVSIDDCAVDTDGNLLVAGKNGSTVTTYDKDLNQLAVFDTGVDFESDTSSSLVVASYGVYVCTPENTVIYFDVSSGKHTDKKLTKDASYYISLQYADADQAFYLTDCEGSSDEASSSSSGEDAEAAAANTALYLQKWDESKAIECGKWFMS